MTIVLKRLESLWTFKQDVFALDSERVARAPLEKQPAEIEQCVCKLLVEQDSSLVLEYNTLQDVLEKTLSEDHVDLAKVTQLVSEALKLSLMLNKKYISGVNDRPNLSKIRLKAHIEQYRDWLARAGYFVVEDPVQESRVEVVEEWWFSALVRRSTDSANTPRLSILRFRRLLVLSVSLQMAFQQYSSWILWADSLVAPYIAYLGILFFVPRLLCNLSILLSHVPQHPWMPKEEINLGWFLRLRTQWDRLWPQIMNDIAWATCGLLMCFVLIGPLQPAAIYLSVGMQFYDLLAAAVRAYYECSRLDALDIVYENIRQADPDNSVLIDFQNCLRARIKNEKDLLCLSLINFAVLLTAVSMALPVVILFSPMLPVLGALVALAITGITVAIRHELTRPRASILEPYKNADKKLNELLKRDVFSSDDEALQPQAAPVQTLSEVGPPIRVPSSPTFYTLSRQRSISQDFFIALSPANASDSTFQNTSPATIATSLSTSTIWLSTIGAKGFNE